MSLEEELRANTEALKENTAAHLKLAEVAMAAAGQGGGKAAPAEKPVPEKDEDEAPKETAAEKKKRLAAEKAAAAKAEAAKKPAAKSAPELETEVDAADLKKAAAAFLGSDDEKVRNANKKNFMAALDHLGASKLTDVDTDEDRARLAGYIAYWEAGLKVDFEAIDEIIAGGGSDGEDEGEDLLG